MEINKTCNFLKEETLKIKQIISFLHQKGFLIALVEDGCQFLSAQQIISLEPEYIKFGEF